MARISRDEELGIWKARVEMAVSVREQYLIDWIYYENIFNDNLWANAIGKEVRRQRNTYYNSATQINELESIVMSMIPRINFNMPIFEVEDIYSRDSVSAMLYEFFAVRVYEVLGMYNVMRDIIMDALLFGGGVHKTGITYAVDQELQDVIMDEMLVSCAVSPKNILWDYRFNDWDEKLWIAEEYIRPLEVVMDSPLYSNKDGLKGNLHLSDSIDKPSRENSIKGDELVSLIEIHDLYNRRLMVISRGHNKFLRYEDDYAVCPYDYLEFTPSRPKRFWGKSIAQTLEELLIRLSQINTFMDNESESSAREIFLIDSSIGDKAVKMLESRKPRVIIPIDGLSGMGADPIRKLVVPSKTFDWQAKAGMIERQIRLLSGVSAMDRGAHEAGVETLGEAQMIAEASEIRVKDRALLLSMFIQNIMSKMLRLASEYIRPERIAEMIGIPIEMASAIEPFDRMKLSVKFGSTAVEYRNSHLNKLLLFAKLFPDTVNRVELVKQIMNALGFGLNDRDLMLFQGNNSTIPSTSGRSQGAGVTEQPTPAPSNEVDVSAGIGEF